MFVVQLSKHPALVGIEEENILDKVQSIQRKRLDFPMFATVVCTQKNVIVTRCKPYVIVDELDVP